MKTNINRQTYDDTMLPNYAPLNVIPVRGKGSRIWDQEDKEYIDFSGGIAVNALGHCHPELVSALKKQAELLWHLSNVYTNIPILSLAKKLCEATFADKVFFCNSGGEANEAAFKLARKYAKDNFGEHKTEIIAFNNSFHGRTLFTVSVGGQEKYTKGFEPLPQGISHLEYDNLEMLSRTISDATCAVVMEPMMGEGGVIQPSAAFISGARDLCNQHNALLIFDEIQVGMGRTGHLFAYMGLGVTPDILTSAKALGCGFPIGAMITTDNIAKSLVVGTHGSTFGGNALAGAVGNAAFDIISDPEFLGSVLSKRKEFETALNAMNAKYKIFKDIRGMGLLIGMELNEQWQGKAREFMAAGIKNGVMVLMAGPNVLRLAPALNIDSKDIAEGLNRLEQAVSQVLGT